MRLRQEKTCQGEHGINKEACSAKGGGAGLMYGFRWYETGTNGKSKYRKAIVGTVDTLANEASALKSSTSLEHRREPRNPQAGAGPSTIAMLVAHHRLKEFAGDRSGIKAFSTRSAYECNLENWILPRWGDHTLDQVKSVAVEDWLDGIKRAKGTRAKIRNLMSALFTHAMRYEWSEIIRSGSCVKAQSVSGFLMFLS